MPPNPIATRHGQQELKPRISLTALLEQEGSIAMPCFKRPPVKPAVAPHLKSQFQLPAKPEGSGAAPAVFISGEFRELMTKGRGRAEEAQRTSI